MQLPATSATAEHCKLVAFKCVPVAENAHRLRNILEMGSMSCVPSIV